MSDLLTREQIEEMRDELFATNTLRVTRIQIDELCNQALRALKDEPGWVSEEQVAAAAKVIADSLLIDAPKLPAECWHGLARAVLAAKPSRG